MGKKKYAVLGIAAALAASAFSTQADAAGQITLKAKSEYGTTSFLAGKLSAPSKKQAEQIVFNYLNTQRSSLKLGSQMAETAFVVQEKAAEQNGNTVLKLQQMYKGVKVWASTQSAVVDKNGVITAVSGSVVPDLDKQANLVSSKKISKTNAVKKAVAALRVDAVFEKTPKAELVVFMKEETAHYAYLVNLN
jgi:thermolysin